jgi:hypothetical protein
MEDTTPHMIMEVHGRQLQEKTSASSNGSTAGAVSYR